VVALFYKQTHRRKCFYLLGICFREDPPIMKLIGRYLSPFVRRVGVSLHSLDIPYTLLPLSTVTDVEAIRTITPLGRVPALELDDGLMLIDSNAILDHIDQMVGPDRALIPANGPARSKVLNLVSFATGACEKIVTAYYERSRRPAELMWNDWAENCEKQARGALSLLDDIQAERGDRPLIGDTLTQADISAIVAYDFACAVLPETLAPANAFPNLSAASERANATAPFAETRWQG
jgi:glutathione S-transferase